MLTTEIPGGGSTQDPGTASGQPGNSEDPSQAVSLSDYTKRLQDDHKFATQEAENWHRKFSKANSERDKYKQGLGKWADTLTPEQVGQWLTQLNQFMTDTEAAEVFNQFQETGKLTMPKSASGGDFEDEWVDPAEKQIEELRAELSQVKGQIQRDSSETSIDRHTKAFVEEVGKWDFSEERRDEVLQGCLSTVKQWGDTPNGLAALKSLDARSIRNLVRDQMPHEEVLELAARQMQALESGRRETKRAKATDAPPGTRSGDETRSEGIEATDDPAEAVKRAMDHFKISRDELTSLIHNHKR